MKKIRTQLLVAFLASIVFLAAISLYVNFFISKLSNAVYETTLLKEATEDITTHSLSISNILMLLLLETDSEKLPAIKAEYEFNKKHFQHAIEKLDNSKKFEKYIIVINQLHQDFIFETEKLITIFNSHFEGEKDPKDKEYINNLKLKEQYHLDKVKNIFVEININSAHIAGDIDRNLNGLLKESNNQKTISLIVILFSSILGGAVALIISKRIVGSVEDMVLTVKKVTAGDLNQRINIKSKDEFSYLANSFNQMLDNVQNSQKQLEATGEQLRKANCEMGEKNEELEKFKRLTEGRELKMIELKEEIKKLKEKGNLI